MYEQSNAEPQQPMPQDEAMVQALGDTAAEAEKAQAYHANEAERQGRIYRAARAALNELQPKDHDIPATTSGAGW